MVGETELDRSESQAEYEMMRRQDSRLMHVSFTFRKINITEVFIGKIC